ncbi:metallophosphoesterase family protein [Arthrobacter sp. NPDC092385]|uniref:metallophosphoesterase family protein n=1 Tax=Arthrobacter sp. NPDC092385 TaxID=3363943 RepID=UPI003809AB35
MPIRTRSPAEAGVLLLAGRGRSGGGTRRLADFARAGVCRNGVAGQATADRMAAESRKRSYDALVLLGDLVYEDGDADLTERVVSEPFAPLTDDGAELLPVLGNHDYRSGEQQQILARLGRQSPWYSEQVGPLRVIVLDSMRVEDREQTA